MSVGYFGPCFGFNFLHPYKNVRIRTYFQQFSGRVNELLEKSSCHYILNRYPSAQSFCIFLGHWYIGHQ